MDWWALGYQFVNLGREDGLNNGLAGTSSQKLLNWVFFVFAVYFWLSSVTFVSLQILIVLFFFSFIVTLLGLILFSKFHILRMSFSPILNSFSLFPTWRHNTSHHTFGGSALRQISLISFQTLFPVFIFSSIHINRKIDQNHIKF